MKLTKGERWVMTFVWLVAFSAICFSYVQAVKNQNKPTTEKTKCSVYIPTEGAVTLIDCTIID